MDVGAAVVPEEDWDDEAYDEDGDVDIDAAAEAEAEEIARRLGDQLWESINKARAEGAKGSPSRSEEAALATMRAVIAGVEKDPLARSTFLSTTVPECGGKALLDVLTETVTAGRIPKEVAQPLSDLLVSLAQSEVLFVSLRQSNPPAVHLDKGKRKREDEGNESSDNLRASKRPSHQPYDFQAQMIEAVRSITDAFAANSPSSPPDAKLISSIQLQLHQVFLFAVTLSARGGPEMTQLREISGLIQILGILSGIQIRPGTSIHPKNPQLTAYNSNTPLVAPRQNDIGTVVYPCPTPSCHKVFSRLFSLRAHERMHASHRPFRCTSCSACFARNHDLKRHAKLHEKKAWRCCGCGKVFSRRDAITRHKNNGSSKNVDGEPCLDKEILEVDVDKQGKERKIRGGSSAATPTYDGNIREEGELPPDVLSQVQAAVLSLSSLLQAQVQMAISSSHTISPSVDSTGGQATLASVIAQVQAQNRLPPSLPITGVIIPPAASAAELQPDLQVADASAPQGMVNSVSAEVSLAVYGLSEEQTRMLQQAIANAAAAAQAQAEAEAALEEEEDTFDDEEDDPDVEVEAIT